MPAYRIYRLKPHLRQQFRWAPHTSGAARIRPRDYAPDGSVEASGVYAAWAALKGGPNRLEVGDVLESDRGELFLCKYVGFEEARWDLSERLDSEPPAPAAYHERDAV